MTIVSLDSLQPHQKRVVKERDDLQVQANALQTFINGDVFPTVDKAEQSRLVLQNQKQFELLAILTERIAFFQYV